MAIMPLRNRGIYPCNAPKASPRIGSISGAMIMAPIITAALFDSKPKVAIAQEPMIKAR